ncbi:unnamed protein product, partial [Symbiodinium sp. CCMP2456]
MAVHHMGTYMIRLVASSMFAAALVAESAVAQTTPAFKMSGAATREEILDHTLSAYRGRSARRENPQLLGSVTCGYQGWFTCPGDGSDRGWHHWGKGGDFMPGACTIDLWPD